MISENVYRQWTDRGSETDDRRKTGVNTVVQFPCPNTRAELPPSGIYSGTYSTVAS